MIDYSSAGVSLNRAEKAKKLIAAAAKTTFTSSVLRNVGHFGGFFALDDRIDGDVLVASTDGVGTKILLGIQLDMIDGIGQDLVNHSINDILVCGARPLFFLDYMAFGRLDPVVAGKIAESLAKGCRENGVALIGGETAEMPGLYEESDFDLAGTIVGMVKRNQILDGGRTQVGDVLIGLPSRGLHTNGYSLARKVFEKEIAGGELKQLKLNDGRTYAEALMEPHFCYYKIFADLLSHSGVHALSHITGGGIEQNTVRVIPDDLRLSIDWESWERPQLFTEIQNRGNVPEEDLRTALNLGIGLIAIAAKDEAVNLVKELTDRGVKPKIIGSVEK